MKEQNKILPISKTVDIDEISYKHFKTDFKYLGLDMCKIIVLSEYADALKKENESLKSSLQPTIEEEQNYYYICLNCKTTFPYNPQSCPYCTHKKFHKTYTAKISESKRIKELEEAAREMISWCRENNHTPDEYYKLGKLL